MSTYTDLTTATACRALSEAGFSYPAEALTIEAREERWVVSLPDGRIAWFAASEAGARRLAVERRVLGLLAARCSFRAPEVLFVSNSGFDVRRMVPADAIPGAFTAAANGIVGWHKKSAAQSGKSWRSSIPTSSKRTWPGGCRGECLGRSPASGSANGSLASSMIGV